MSIKIALAGNPNCGKTTLFNALTGSNQFVGNWPGVTVEKKEGKLRHNPDVVFTDLPGIYSLSPYTLEEVVARDYLVGERPNAILNIIDGTNLERNLYLTSQLLELGIPTVIAINMMDVVEKNGDKIDVDGLSNELGCKIVRISALKGTGIDEAASAAIAAAHGDKPIPKHLFSGAVEHAIGHIEEAAVHGLPEEQQRFYAVKIFERDEKILKSLSLSDDVLAHIENDIQAAERELDDDAESITIGQRYTYVGTLMEKYYKRKNKSGLTVSDKIDKVLTNRFAALPIFAAIMFLVYYVSVTTVGALVTDFTNEVLFGEWILPALSGWLESLNCAPWLIGLLVDGIVGGVGSVLGFVPQMLILFIFLAFLEACGYMSRVAFVMDRIFRKFGLSGKSFIPMLIGTGCSVPGIMASRTIENERDRRMTIMTTPFIPCGAKLPVIALIAGALFDGAWWVAPSAYFVGILAVIISGTILKKTKLFAGDVAPFVMELPAYHMPTVGNVLRSMWERGWSFIKKAGTVILLSTVVLWFLQSFGIENGAFGMIENVDNSILAFIGTVFAWIFIPLGFGMWQAAVAVFTGLIAKENIVATFGVLYGFASVSDAATEVYGHLAADMSPLCAYSFLIFNLLCAPCFAAIGAMARELGSGKWTLFAVGYQCLFAYAVSYCIYNVGIIFSGEFFWWEAIRFAIALVIIAFAVFMLLRPYRNKNGEIVKL